jgi:hypothetical protein
MEPNILKRGEIHAHPGNSYSKLLAAYAYGLLIEHNGSIYYIDSYNPSGLHSHPDTNGLIEGYSFKVRKYKGK